MTYRERREARAERLRGWAAKREEKADAAFETAHERASHIPFGQPILVGHHSEGRDRRYRAGIARQMDQGVEHTRKAESMASRAANIEDQLASSIYSDDPDAIEQLRARIAKLEAERDRIKAYNKTARAGKPDPSVLDERQQRQLVIVHQHATDYDRRRGMQFPSYHLQNLSGNITRQRKRLAELERRQQP